MSLINTLLTALRGIASNTLRSALTSLGIMIGVASVIITLALGNGARAAVEASFSFLGSDQVQISTRNEFTNNEMKNAGKPFSYEDGLNMPDQVPAVKKVEMSVAVEAKIRQGRNVLDMSVSGMTADAIDSIAGQKSVQPVGWPDGKMLEASAFMGQGRFFTPAEVLGNAEVCVLGYQTADDLFAGRDPIGQTVWIGRKPYTVIGVMAELEAVDPKERAYSKPNDSVTMPISTVIRDFFTKEPEIMASVTVRDATKMTEAKEQIKTYLRSRHAIMPDGEGVYKDDFDMMTKQDLLGAQQEAARTFSILLTAMAIVSLGVGGIGIMNVMLVSVSERTREIGVRLAIGARSRDIVAQFLFESVLLSAASGVLGIALGVLLIPLASSLNQGVALLAPASIPLSFGVALCTGITFGIYPAIRASRLDPIEALRHE